MATKQALQEVLDAKKIKYSSKATKAELEELIAQNSKKAEKAVSYKGIKEY